MTEEDFERALRFGRGISRRNGDKISAVDKQPLQRAIDEVKAALEKDDADAITRGLSTLQQAQYKVAESLYRTTQSTGGEGETSTGGAGGRSAGPQGDVIDAEVVEDEKK